MKKHIHIFIVLILIALPVASCKAETQERPTETLVIQSSNGKVNKFQVEIAATPAEQTQGLMDRHDMPEDHGMLFIFAQERPRNFWMKNTYIPLDILFIKSSGTILHIHENAIPHDETPIPSEGSVQMVLELNGGTVERLGIREGDLVLMEGRQE